MQRNPVEGDDEALQTLERFKGKIFKICLDLLKHKDEDKFYTVNHGDCWNNNMLLKKDPKSSRNFDQIFIDFQVLR